MKIKRFFVIIFVFLVSFLGSRFILSYLDHQSSKQTYADNPTFEDNAAEKTENEYLILMVGVDKNSAEEVDEDFTRTDTIMLVRADAKTGQIKLLSIPRDSRVLVRNSFDKVNHAHAYGGIELTMQTLRNFLGLDIDYYVQVNYQALIDVVNAIGGVDYEVPEGVNIKRGSLEIKEGMNHFDGWETMWYLRTRNIYNNGDIGRVNAQQDFMKAMVDQMVKKSKEMDLMAVITSYIKHVKTNLPMSAMVDLLKNINKFSSDKVDMEIVPGMEQTMHGISYYIPDYEKTWTIRDELFSSFKLKKWTKEDSGYMEYADFGHIIDQSSYNGLIPYTEFEKQLVEEEEKKNEAKDTIKQAPNLGD